MIVQQTYGGKAQLRGIESRVLRNMSGDELSIELDRVTREIAHWNRMVKDRPKWYRKVKEIRRQHNCLQAEKRRIEAELSKRAAEIPSDIDPDGEQARMAEQSIRQPEND